VTAFVSDVVEWLRNTKEVTIRTAKHPDTDVIIWIVVAADGEVYVRSVKGERGRWYRDLRSDGRATLLVNRRNLPVHAVAATDEHSVERASQEFRTKYRSSSYVGSMLRAEVLPTTMRLEPRAD